MRFVVDDIRPGASNGLYHGGNRTTMEVGFVLAASELDGVADA